MKALIIWAESINRNTGGTMHLLGWQHGMRELGHQVKVVAPAYGGDRGSLVSDVSFITLPRRSTFSFALLQVLVVIGLPWWLLRYRPNVVFARTCFLGFLMYAFCRVCGVSFILEGGSSPVEDEMSLRGENRFLAWMIRGFNRVNHRSCSAVVCVTAGMRDELLRRGAKPEKVFVVHNGAHVDVMRPTEQAEARGRFNWKTDDYVIGFAGSLVSWQGLDLLIEAAGDIVNTADRRVRFAIAGNGPSGEALCQKVEQRGLRNNFDFLDPMPFHEVAVFYNACDLIVIPICDPRKLRYGLDPLKFWDAISVGLPVIMPEGCQLEAILEELSLPGTFRVYDSGHLGEVIIEALSRTVIYQRRREQTHQLVREKYSWRRVAEALIEVSETCSR
jgi:glycosyltransferase involved in cell wall biosynthesis